VQVYGSGHFSLQPKPEATRISPTKIGPAALAALARGAVFVSSAFAGTAVTNTASWTYEEGALKNTDQ
jgi:hypothetical protein